MTAEALAKRFHETYERLAPDFGYETRLDSAVPWDDVPEQNRNLMVAVAATLLGEADEPRLGLATTRDLLDELRARGREPVTADDATLAEHLASTHERFLWSMATALLDSLPDEVLDYRTVGG